MCPAGITYNTYDFINWFKMPLVVPAVKPVFKQTNKSAFEHKKKFNQSSLTKIGFVANYFMKEHHCVLESPPKRQLRFEIVSYLLFLRRFFSPSYSKIQRGCEDFRLAQC